MPKLNDRQKRFAEEYVTDFNASRAYLAAGYSDFKGYRNAAYMLKNRANVSAYIQKLLQKAKEELTFTKSDIIKELQEVINSAEKDADKLKALDMMAKHIDFYGADSSSKNTIIIPPLPTKPNKDGKLLRP